MCHFDQFHLFHVNQKQNLVWKGVWIAMVWSLWVHKNKVVFEQGKVDVEEVFHLAQLKSWVWMKSKLSHISFSLSDLILNHIPFIRIIR